MRDTNRDFLVLKGGAGWVQEGKAKVGTWRGLSSVESWTVGLQD